MQNFLVALFLSILNFFNPPHKIITPLASLRPTPATQSATVVFSIPPQKPQIPQIPQPNIPWGTTEKLADHLYRTYVGRDEKMGTPEEILTALNLYRKNHGVSPLRQDENLCKFAQNRAAEQEKGLDVHKGFIDFLNNPDNWRWLDIKNAGENASYGYTLSGTHLIEWVFDSDEEHRSNQLDPQWNLSCAGVSGVTVNILFGKR